MELIPITQASAPCPHCGSWYLRGDKCNICGATMADGVRTCIVNDSLFRLELIELKH